MRWRVTQLDLQRLVDGLVIQQTRNDLFKWSVAPQIYHLCCWDLDPGIGPQPQSERRFQGRFRATGMEPVFKSCEG